MNALRMRRSLAAIVAVLATMTVAACGRTDEPAEPAELVPEPEASVVAHEQSAELREALARGDVDHDAYLAGFQRYSACLAAAGHTVVVHGEEDGRPLLRYAVPAAAVDSGADEECYDREFEPLDTAWQLANEDTSLWAETARECLRDRGIEPAATLAEMNAQLDDAGIEHLECLGDG